MSIRRIPALFYTYKYHLFALLTVSSGFLGLLLHSGLFCVRLQTWHHVRKACNEYSHTESRDVCRALCAEKTVESLECHPDNIEGFVAQWENNHRIAFKAPFGSNGRSDNPLTTDFLSVLKANARSVLNYNLTLEDLHRLSNSRILQRAFSKLDQSHVQLLENREFLLTVLHETKDIFPRVLGSCGAYFAYEYVEPLKRPKSSLMESNKEEWCKSLRLAIYIMDLVSDLDSVLNEPHRLCQVDLQTFGLVDSNKRLKISNVAHIYPESMLKLRLNGLPCRLDEDCDLEDCRSRCDLESGHCHTSPTNSNLQLICEKIFLGWRLSNSVLMPGLLLAQDTPSNLAVLLRLCANPDSEPVKARTATHQDIRTKLYAAIVELEQSANG